MSLLQYSGFAFLNRWGFYDPLCSLRMTGLEVLQEARVRLWHKVMEVES